MTGFARRFNDGNGGTEHGVVTVAGCAGECSAFFEGGVMWTRDEMLHWAEVAVSANEGSESLAPGLRDGQDAVHTVTIDAVCFGFPIGPMNALLVVGPCLWMALSTDRWDPGASDCRCDRIGVAVDAIEIAVGTVVKCLLDLWGEGVEGDSWRCKPDDGYEETRDHSVIDPSVVEPLWFGSSGVDVSIGDGHPFALK